MLTFKKLNLSDIITLVNNVLLIDTLFSFRKKSAGHDTEWTNYSRGSNIEEWICVMDRYHDLSKIIFLK